MSTLIDYAVTDFWAFFWFLIITGLTIAGCFDLTISGYKRTLRHRVMMKHGYPPPHCDADGDFKEESEKKEEAE
jgi:hypothetical protein